MTPEPKKETCPNCYGTGMEVVPGNGARPCSCRVVHDPRKLFGMAQIPERHERSAFQTFKPQTGNGSQLKAFNYAFRLVREYPGVERGLLFAGPCGVGKTHLAASVLRGLMEKGVPCLFKDFGQLLKEIQATYGAEGKASEEDVLAPACAVDVLLLDELGATRMTEWATDILGQVIGVRYNKKKITLVTTNYRDERALPGEETLEDRIGARLRSRLREMCKTVVMDGEDYRKLIDEEDV